MARVIRNCWVYRPLHRYKYLPRPTYGHPGDFDMDRDCPGPSEFPSKLSGDPPKLWLVWLSRVPANADGEVFRQQYPKPKGDQYLEELFGPDWDAVLIEWIENLAGRMEVFPNTPSTNKLLWRVKHLIEVRPISFPNGEPQPGDEYRTTLSSEGECRVDKALEIEPERVTVPLLGDETYITTGYMKSKLAGQIKKGGKLNEDEHHADPSRSHFS